MSETERVARRLHAEEPLLGVARTSFDDLTEETQQVYVEAAESVTRTHTDPHLLQEWLIPQRESVCHIIDAERRAYQLRRLAMDTRGSFAEAVTSTRAG